MPTLRGNFLQGSNQQSKKKLFFIQVNANARSEKTRRMTYFLFFYFIAIKQNNQC